MTERSSIDLRTMSSVLPDCHETCTTKGKTMHNERTPRLTAQNDSDLAQPLISIPFTRQDELVTSESDCPDSSSIPLSCPVLS